MSKKGALELSITAIVVLIIAITLLGLGIGFIKKQFGGATTIFTEEFQKIKGKLREDIQTGELLAFSPPEDISSGKPKAFPYGIRNTAQNAEKGKVCFRVEVRCLKPFTYGSFCDAKGQKNDVAVGGFDSETGEAVLGDKSWFKSIGPGNGEIDLKNFEGDVYDAEFLVRGLKPDSYSMEMNVYKEPDDRACSDGQFGSNYRGSLVYQSESFILKVV